MTPHVSSALLRTQTDARLAALAAAGHDRAFEALVERYRAPLLRYAANFRLDGAAAEDVVQASCLAAWAALGEGTEVRDVRAWLYRIVHNRALNALRAAREGVTLTDAADARPGPQDDVEARQQVRDALDGIAALPDRQRAALVAVAIDGRPHADVGRDLGVSAMAVRKLVSRARGTLRAAATAVTPMPLATWLAQAPAGGGDGAVRIGELVAAGGSASFAGASVLKAGAVAVTIGAVATGGPGLADRAAEHGVRKAETSQVAAPAPAPAESSPAATTPAALRRVAQVPRAPAPRQRRLARDDAGGERSRDERRSDPAGHDDDAPDEFGDDALRTLEDPAEDPRDDDDPRGPGADEPEDPRERLARAWEDGPDEPDAGSRPGEDLHASSGPGSGEPGSSGPGSGGAESSGPGSGDAAEDPALEVEPAEGP